MGTRRQPDDPGIPIAFHPLSNGEYAPLHRSPMVHETVRRVLDTADQHARRLGISRRSFLRTSAGMALTLTTLSACSREQAAERGPDTATGATGRPGGTFTLPPQTTIDVPAATEALAPPASTVPGVASDFVVDVQTHLLDYAPGSITAAEVGVPQAACGPDAAACMGIDAWLDLVLGASDTTVAVISAIPIVADPDPLSAAVMERARAAAELVGCSDRVLIQGHATPTLGELPAALDAMAAVAAQHDIAAWKAYTHEGPAWRLDDAVGTAFCDQVRALGQRIVCVHKGLGPAAAAPDDVGPAAVRHPDLAFCIYHSGYDTGTVEGPYQGDGGAPAGIDRLIASCLSAGLEPGQNVYAELGSTWWNLMQRPDEAAHAIGKLLVAFGPDNILWGTDSIWYGSPQSQIDAFRAFRITPEFQERFGYPELTDEVKARILGLNAASVYGIDPTLTRCTVPLGDRQAMRRDNPVIAPTGPTSAAAARAAFEADHPWFTPRSNSSRA